MAACVSTSREKVARTAFITSTYYHSSRQTAGQTSVLEAGPGLRQGSRGLAARTWARYDGPAAGWLSAGHQLTPEVPCVVAHRTTAWTVEAGRTARRWFDDFLREGLDPVEALHRLPAGGSTRDFEWATPIVWTSFQSWQTHREIARRPRREPGLRLDRQTQRGMALNPLAVAGDHQERRRALTAGPGPRGP